MRNDGRPRFPGYPNGALVTPDGDALIVVEAKAQRLVRVPIQADGSAGEPSTVAELPDTDPDGVALAADGSLVGHALPPRRARAGRHGMDRSSWWSTTTSPRRSMRRRTSRGWGSSSTASSIANVGDTYLSIGDLGVAGTPLHLPLVE